MSSRGEDVNGKAVPPAVAALAGFMITRMVIDDSVTLILHRGDREARLRIDGRGSLERQGQRIAFDPDSAPASVGPLIEFIHERIDEADVTPEGGLRLRIGKALLCVDPDDHQVSWSISTSDGAQASSIAEGKVVWQ